MGKAGSEGGGLGSRGGSGMEVASAGGLLGSRSIWWGLGGLWGPQGEGV